MFKFLLEAAKKVKIMQLFFAVEVWSIAFLLAGCAVNEKTQETPTPVLPMPDSRKEGSGSYRPQVIENYNTQGQQKEILFTKEPSRVVCVWQNSIETLLALGKGDRIIAAFGLPDKKYLRPEYQEAYENIPYRQYQLMDNEAILMMEPDFILAWNSTFGSRNYLRPTDFWNSRGIHSYIAASSRSNAPYRTVEVEYQYILDMGRIFHVEERAIQIVEQMKKEIAYARKKTQGRKKDRAVIIEVQGRQLTVYGEKNPGWRPFA